MNYNPADYFVQLLAIAPNRELECRTTIKKICDSYAVSTLAEEVNALASNLGSNEELVNRRHKWPQVSSHVVDSVLRCVVAFVAERAERAHAGESPIASDDRELAFLSRLSLA